MDIHLFHWLSQEVYIPFLFPSRSTDSVRPNRILIVTICNLGMCPCLCCKLPMADVPNMGTRQDMIQRQLLVRTDDNNLQNKILDAWALIYERNYAVDSLKVQALLKDESLIPTMVSVNWTRAQSIYTNLCGRMQNTFLERLGAFSFCVFVMLVVDLLHEFELGIWKAILSHLLRMLESLKGDKLHELDQRKANPIDKWFPTTQLILFLSKVSSGPFVWKRYNPTIFEKHFRDEKSRSSGFWRPPPGMWWSSAFWRSNWTKLCSALFLFSKA